MLFLVQFAALFTGATFAFDVIHVLLHKWEHSRFSWLRSAARLHMTHHQFLGRDLSLQPSEEKANLRHHVWPEYLTSVAVLLPTFAFLDPACVAAVLILRTLFLVGTLHDRGADYNHRRKTRVNGIRSPWSTLGDYHALHHVYPQSAFGSFTPIIDLVFGTMNPIAGRRFLITGASGAYGLALKAQLEAAGAEVETAKFGVDFKAGNYGALKARMERADVLVVAHGTKYQDCWNANYVTFTDIIEMFRKIGRERLLPPEVWAVGSEIEFHGTFGMKALRPYSDSKRAFAECARTYYRDNEMTYRHIVPSAFTSRMGPGLMSARFAVAVTLFFARRGFRYVPVTYTGFALWNYLFFRFSTQKKTARPLQDRPQDSLAA